MLVNELHLLKKVCMKALEASELKAWRKTYTDTQRYFKYSGMQAVLEKSNGR